MSELCLKCGGPEGKYSHMCEKCYRSSVVPSTLPKVLKMKICSSCSFMVNVTSNQRIVEWENGIRELVKESLSVIEDGTLLDFTIHRNGRDDYLTFLEVQSEIEHSGLLFHQDHSCELRITYGVCNRCSRQSGNYFEANIQFRGGKRSLTDEELKYAMAHVRQRIDESTAENAFISHIDQIHKGLDFYLGDKSVAKEIARDLQHHFGAHFQESFSLAGRKDGKDIYRSTYLVRLLDLRTRDFVNYRDSIHILAKVHEKSASVIELTTGQKSNLVERDLEKLKLVHGDVVEALVVSAESGEAQVLDPASYKTVSVITPQPLSSGESYTFFRCEEGLFKIPD